MFIRYLRPHFEYMIKKHETLTDKSTDQICVNKNQKRITIEVKSGYYRELLTPETMKILQED